MATTKLPSLSLNAAGQLGGAMIASHWKGKPYQKRYVRPHDPKTQLQIARRARVKFLCNAWRRLTDAEKATWEPLRHRRELPLYNVFLADNMPVSTLTGGTYRQGNRLGTSTYSPGHTIAAQALPRAVRVTWNDLGNQPDWCWMILRQTPPLTLLSPARDAIAYLNPGAGVLEFLDFHPVIGAINWYWIRDYGGRNLYTTSTAGASATPLP